MSFCKKCGAYIPERSAVCLACGTDPNDQGEIKFPPPRIEGAPKKDADEEPEVLPTCLLSDRTLNEIRYRVERLKVSGSPEPRNYIPAPPKHGSSSAGVDLDLSKLKNNAFVTVRVGGEVKRFYCNDIKCGFFADYASVAPKRFFTIQLKEV